MVNMPGKKICPKQKRKHRRSKMRYMDMDSDDCEMACKDRDDRLQSRRRMRNGNDPQWDDDETEEEETLDETVEQLVEDFPQIPEALENDHDSRINGSNLAMAKFNDPAMLDIDRNGHDN
jgi:molybdopterin converting factor small subunit